MKKLIFEIWRVPPFGLVLCRITFCWLLSLAAPFAWAGNDAGMQAYRNKDYAKALIEFHSLAQQGNSDAQYNLGQMYRLGEGVPQSDAEAVKWYLLAAGKGDVDAQYNLGQMYRQGIGVPPDDAKAAKWYRLAAKQGHAGAIAKLKAMNGKQNHAGVAKRAEIAATGKLPVSSQGNDMPQDDAEAMKQVRLAAEQGNAKAQRKLGMVYALGQGVHQDFQEAVKWFRLAAEQGEADAQHNLGVAYHNGQGVPKDLQTALYWFEKAALAGQPYAQANLGWSYMSNYLELVPDYRLAMEWNLKAAYQGSAAGSENIGLLYENGWGVPVNYLEAASWYEKAINQVGGSGQAELQLGSFYEHGLGVQKDLTAAEMLYRAVVEKYGNGKFAGVAKARLAAIQRQQ